MEKKGVILQDVLVEKLVFSGKGLGHTADGKAIMISGGVIPGQTVSVRVLKTRKGHIEGQMVDIITHSSIEVPLPAHFQVYGGCKWLPIEYSEQLRIKENQVKECFSGFERDGLMKETVWHPIVASPEIYGYRNKLEFSFGKYISKKEEVHDEFRFGFHKQGEFDRIVNCDFCVLASDQVNAIFREVDKLSRASGMTTYDPKTFKGVWRHLVVRESRATGECMVVFSVNTSDELFDRTAFDGVWKQLQGFPGVATVVLLHNPGRADIVTGEVELLTGSGCIEERILDNSFEIAPKSFFQTNSPGAEVLYSTAFKLLNKRKSGGILLDLYAGTGTIGTIFGKKFDEVFSVEIVPDASRDARKNAARNQYLVPSEVITAENFSLIDSFRAELTDSEQVQVDDGDISNSFISQTLDISQTKKKTTFYPCNIPAEIFLSKYLEKGMKADLLIVDPPRDGMHPSAPPSLVQFEVEEILYISCNPSTLVRDLQSMIESGKYAIADIVPVDMFPHTHHIETVVRLVRK